MTVKQLLEKLTTLDPEMIVVTDQTPYSEWPTLESMRWADVVTRRKDEKVLWIR